MSETPAQTPSLGRIVHYRLSDADVEAIVEARMSGEGRGNVVRAGDLLPAIIVRVAEESEGDPDVVGVYVACNLQVMLDGTHTLWVQGSREGHQEGAWSWPSRV